MNETRQALAFITANPGCVVGDIVAHLAPGNDADARKRCSTRVCVKLNRQMEVGKVRRTGRALHYRYWPTDITQLDLRRFNRDGSPRKASKPQQQERIRIRRLPKRKAKSATRRQTKRNAAPKPTAAQQPRVIRRAPEKLSPPAPPPKQVQPETVAQFLKRGGRIQYPGPGDASQPLRFDHTDTKVPAKRRAPSRRRVATAL